MGIDGQVYYAEKYLDGYMIKTFQNVSTVLGIKKIQEMGWKYFVGATEDIKKIRSTILDKNGNIDTNYSGMQGLALYAEFYFDNNITNAFRSVKAIIDKNQFKKLKWKTFIGTVKEFDDTYNMVMDEEGQLRQEAIGPHGLAYIAKKHFSGSPQTAYSNIKAVLDRYNFHNLKWRTFNVSIKIYKTVNTFIHSFSSINDFIKEYKGTEGYIRIADKFTGSNMSKAYKIVSSILGVKQFKKLGWIQFDDTTHEWHTIRTKLFDKNGHIRKEFMGTDGHVAFADLYTNSHMVRAFTATYNMLGSRQAVEKKLQWKYYRGNTTKNFKIQRQLFKDEQSIHQFITQYKGRDGHITYTDKYHEGNLNVAIENVKYFLTKKQFEQLQWRRFFGSTEQLKMLLEDFNKHYPSKWKGTDNQKRIANKIFDGYLYTSYRSTLEGRDYLFGSPTNSLIKFKKLKWKSVRNSAKKIP